MIQSIAFVTLFALAGDLIVYGLGLPVPGAAIGLLALTGLFTLRGGPDAATARLFDAVCPYFPLFFVPAATGVLASVETMIAAWAPLVAAVLLGTLATLAVTGLVAQALLLGAGKELSA